MKPVLHAGIFIPPDEGALRERHSGTRWISWWFGAGLLVAVVVASLHFSQWREFVRISEEAHPRWLFLAILLQAATYLAHGQIWRSVVGTTGFHIPLAVIYRLSLAKLFVDQVLPSGGLSGTVMMARALEHRHVPRRAVMTAVAVTTASYYAGYMLCLAGALIALIALGQPHKLALIALLAFIPFAAALIFAVLVLSGRQRGRITEKLSRFRTLRRGFDSLRTADPKLVRNPRLLSLAIAFQAAVVLLDSATLWLLIQSLGMTASPAAVFACFMVSSLFRSIIAFVPGGLGTFEASSVLTLKLAGVPLPVALAATLLFRGLSLWLPMIPGLWFSREAMTRHPRATHRLQLENYWSLEPEELMSRLHTSPEGLSNEEARNRLREYGSNELQKNGRVSRAGILLRQLRSPLLLLLLFAAVASAATGEWIDATIVFVIVATSMGITYSREYSAQSAANALRARVRAHAKVLRDAKTVSIPLGHVVPGDIVLLSAGSLAPGDAVILEATDFFVSEAVLTGESFPVVKQPGAVPAAAPLARRANCIWLGTNVRSGNARCVVVNTGRTTEFGGIAHRLTLRPPETEFDRGVRRFGYMLTSAMFVMVLVVYVAHMFAGRAPMETLLFSIALAVGLSPELLPAILSVNLARGAKMMARHGVLVRHLSAIENLGSMDVLCTDKTGTLTEGEVRLEGAYDASGASSAEVLELAAQNAALETGLANPLDDAILQGHSPAVSTLRKLGEIPFDFVRRRISVIVSSPNGATLITKGAFQPVLGACTQLRGNIPLDEARISQLQQQFNRWSSNGIRVIAVATREVAAKPPYTRDDERDLTFLGFVTFLDRPKQGAAEALASLAGLGVAVKLITGDNRLVAQHIATLVGMSGERVLTGAQLDELRDEALWHAAERTDLFVEVDPNQKERIILSLKKMGHVVGFLGDGVNDAPAMHAADTSLSVEHAADVARDTADFVLLKQHLDVIRRGIEEGRRTFANTLKYVLTTISANLGNMVSMAGASLVLPFLPLTAGQILLNNFLSDVPAMGMADDNVDHELIERPRRWDIRFITRYMIEFGILSSIFDLLMFAILLVTFRASVEVFRTGWFIESLLTELAVALVVRTRRPFFRSRPGTLLLALTMIVMTLAFAIPFLPFTNYLGFIPIPVPLLLMICGITILYVVATELLKKWFYRRAT